eukprot:TRINITY_DN96020_c0_g1_i1.p1 TRINITY_DN96020_c0_g1~~TRINITY_DN96020_c0_g1_i1.p1  ORF type:complete len:526 (+),score=46.43 TRINITY_DN96020_c0_g1_i1:51-1580(+)
MRSLPSLHLSGPRELLRLRRIVRRSSELAGRPAPSLEEELFRAKQIQVEKEQQARVLKCELDTPEFITKGGSFDRTVTVELRATAPGTHTRYVIRRLDGTSNAAAGDRVTMRSPLYRRPFVLDEPGSYQVTAVAFRDSGFICQRSLSVAERFLVTPGASGTKLRSLPNQMVKGLLSIAGSTERGVASSLDMLKSAIARAAHAVESSVHVTVKGKGSRTDISFSVEVDRSRNAVDMTANLTDPSLVANVASVLKVDVSDINVEASASQLEEVLLSLGWKYPRSLGSSRAQPDYLDGSCLVYAEERLLEIVDYRGAQSMRDEKVSSAKGWSAGCGSDAAVMHSGDVMNSDGGNHALRVKLSMLPAEATDCIFTLSAYNCRDLSRFVAPCMHIFNSDCPEHVLSNYTVADAGTASAVVVCSLTREGDVWTVRAHARTGDGTVRDYTPIESIIAPIQARYCRNRCRMPIALLYALWRDDRMLPRAAAADSEYSVILPLLDLQVDLFRLVLTFL